MSRRYSGLDADNRVWVGAYYQLSGGSWSMSCLYESRDKNKWLVIILQSTHGGTN